MKVNINGKPVAMVFPLRLHGEPNPLPVDNCLDAMRGYGRCHTTRTFEPYKAYSFKEGDIALAYSGQKRVAFRVGKQYKITAMMMNDPSFQQEWANREKHSAKELLNFKNQPEVWGLHMEPLGDYVNGEIVPFPNRAAATEGEIAPPINIHSGSDSPLGAALTNPTETARYKGKIQHSYPVSFRGNPYRAANTSHKAEKYFNGKPEGVPYVSAEDAYQAWKETVPVGRDRDRLMAEIIATKLQQHPKLMRGIEANGGTRWLEQCEHTVTGRSFWEGKGRNSPFILALIEAYEQVQKRETTHQVEPTQHPKPTPERIDPGQLAPHQIPVWGANSEGRHGKGLAKLMFGNHPHQPGTVGSRAVYGKGEGYHEGRKGGSYALVTKDLARDERSIPLDQIEAQIDRFLEFARKNPTREFLVTPIGTGLAGYSPQEIGGLFQGKELPNNVRLPLAFSEKANHPVTVRLSAHAEALSPRRPVTSNPLAHLQPLNSRVAKPMQKDIAMAEMATQFIGRSAAPQGVPSSTRNYEQAWGERANTGNYTANDVVMVSGSGPWRGVTEAQIQKTFSAHYIPLLESAIAARAAILVGNAKGTDQLAQQYLQERGYKIGIHPGSQNLPTPFLQCQPPIREKTMNESQFYNQIAQKYAPVIAALLYYERTNNYEGSIYRATWDGTELKLFDKDSDQPKLAAQYNDQSQKYEAISLQNSTARLTAKDIDILEGLAVSLQKQGIIEGLQQRSYLDLDF
jgi:hypothetical protein